MVGCQQITNSFIKRKKNTHQAYPMNQIYVTYVHQITKYVYQTCPINQNT